MASSLRQRHLWTSCQVHQILLELKRLQYEDIDKKAWELPKLRCLGAVVCLCKEVVGTTRATSRATKRILISSLLFGWYLKMRINYQWILKEVGNRLCKTSCTKIYYDLYFDWHHINKAWSTLQWVIFHPGWAFSKVFIIYYDILYMQQGFSEVSTITISQWKENWTLQLWWSL